jgi:hypothetical protein
MIMRKVRKNRGNEYSYRECLESCCEMDLELYVRTVDFQYGACCQAWSAAQ